jgi:phosphodiesterase/alkaline phosphatase D-like protein
MTTLRLGPLLRHVGERHATIWLETTSACAITITVGDVTANDTTFKVAGHYYGMVVVAGLEPGSTTEYSVDLDGIRVWPPDDTPFPPSRIRTLAEQAGAVRVLFGSCREPQEGRGVPDLDPDVLSAYAVRMASQAHERWPDVLLMLGDQVYADDPSPAIRRLIDERRAARPGPRDEVADYDEYAALYDEAWGRPEIRWLLSTLPSGMIFDDHDVRDDWNTSHAWRMDMQATKWWEQRITVALMSYWVYQHLGNLSPSELCSNETLAAVRAADDGEDILRRFAVAADREADGAKGAMWSFRRDLGRVRLLVIDSRCGRLLADGRRAMVGDREFRWIEEQVEEGGYDHLVVGTSVPWLLPRALHDIEAWDEAISDGTRGRTVARVGEWLRRAVDLEHWAAFRESFDRLASLFGRIGRGDHGEAPPATICVLSGDVHHSYVAEASYPDDIASRVYQITCSPMHNTIPRVMRFVFRLGWSARAARATRILGRSFGVPPPSIGWRHPAGPLFGNELGLLAFEGRSATVTFERAVPEPALRPGERRDLLDEGLAIAAELSLTKSPGR